MNKIKILTDSACDIPKEIETELGIKILPFHVTVGDKDYLERIDFTNDEFYDILCTTPTIPVTSQITSFQLYDEYKDIYSQGYSELIYITINSLGSATYDNAIMAKKMFFEKNPELSDKFEIHVVDSKTYTMGYGYPVIEAAKKANKNISSKKIIAFLEDWFNSVEVYFAPYSLEFAKKSGRISCAAAFVGELVGLKPIISIIDGKMTIVEKVRGEKAIVPALIKKAREHQIPATPYCCVYGMNNESGEEFHSICEKELKRKSEGLYHIGAAISINAGPKVVGIIIKGKNRSNNS